MKSWIGASWIEASWIEASWIGASWVGARRPRAGLKSRLFIVFSSYVTIAMTDMMRTALFKMSDRDDQSDFDIGVAVKPKEKTKRPPMYKVLIRNDDYTPMDFVVHVLERFFGLSRDHAVNLMLAVHNQGAAVVGVFTFEVAETKVTQVMDYSRQHQHPLQCEMEHE